MNTIQADTSVAEQVLTTSGKVDAYAFTLRWQKVAGTHRRESLRSVNKRLSATWGNVLSAAEANTRRLTGRPRF